MTEATLFYPGFWKPSRYYLCAGRGDASRTLVAFDRALLEAGIGDTNLVKLSSILPPGARRTNPGPIEPGSLVAVAYASRTSCSVGECVAAAVAIAHPEDRSRASLIMEYSAAASKHEVEEEVVRMAREGMVSRGLTVREVESISVETRVLVAGAVFAAVVEI